MPAIQPRRLSSLLSPGAIAGASQGAGLRYDERVKRRSVIAGLVLLLASLAAAQVRGIPASVTSPRSDQDFILTPVGIPASVTSLGPRGYAPLERMVPTGPPRRNRLGRVVNVAPIPLFYGVPYYPVVYVPEAGVTQRVVEAPTRPSEPQRIIVEIRDTRPLPETKPTPEAAPAVAPAARVEAAEPERVATVFIFRDGSRKELKDFAITDSELIDLSAGLIKRSPLAELDRAATLKENAAKGVEVHLPAAASD